MVRSTARSLRLPRVTVVVTCYNYEKYIERSLLSVDQQTYENLECIIVDDKSSDKSRDVVRKFLKGSRSKSFRLIEHGENTGQLGAMISGVAEASGQFICFLDADDIWAPDFVKAHIWVHLNPHHTAGMSTCDMIMLDDDENLLQGTWVQLRKLRQIQEIAHNLIHISPPDPILLQGKFPTFDPDVHKLYIGKQSLKFEWFFSPTSGCMFRKDLICLMMPKDATGFRLSADYYLSMHASVFTDCLIIDCPLVGYRIHQGNGFSKNPVVGGDYRPGIWHNSMNVRYNKAIADHIFENFESYANVFGAEKAGSVLNMLTGSIPRPQKGKILSKLIKFSLKRP